MSDTQNQPNEYQQAQATSARMMDETLAPMSAQTRAELVYSYNRQADGTVDVVMARPDGISQRVRYPDLSSAMAGTDRAKQGPEGLTPGAPGTVTNSVFNPTSGRFEPHTGKRDTLDDYVDRCRNVGKARALKAVQ